VVFHEDDLIRELPEQDETIIQECLHVNKSRTLKECFDDYFS
jgi:hypothetical protein